MTCKELPAQAANINRAIGSPTTCTPSTVEALRLYLSPKPVPEPQPVRPFVINRRPKSQQLAVQDSRRRGAGKRKTPEVAILEVPQNGPNFAQPHERFALATEVVNATLKALTDAIKRPIAPQKLPPKQLTKSPSSSSISSSRQKEKPKPLQPRCVNRISNLPGERTRSRRSSSVLSVRYAPGLLFQAECARIAFATLRSIQSQKISGIEMPYLQLETGMSVLIGKLIALDLIDLAVKELRILKKRLDGLLGSSSTSSNATSTDVLTSGSKQETHKETLADLLHFPIASDTGPILAMVVTLQLQVLKIVAIKNRPDIIENAFNHLKLSTPYSPVNLILRQASTDAPESQLKKARQLETLAQSLLSLCPSVSSGEDEKAVDPKISLAPEAALNLQLLALEIRLRWWKLSCHQGDIAKEMAEPFTKCLISFRRRSRLSIEETYKKAQSAFKAFVRFVDAGTDGTTLASSSRGSAFLEIYSLISDLAQEILKYNEAIHWTMVSTEILISTAASQSRICAYKCRIAMLNLYASKTTLNNQDLSKSLEEASKELQGDLQGDSTELDGLLLAVASLRKAAFPVLHDYYRTPETIKAKHSPQIIDQCFNLLLQSLEFVSRYVGRSLTPGEAGRTTLRYEQRKRLASNVAGPLIESVVAIGRLSMGSNTDIWSRIDTALQRCACLASSLEDPKSRTESKSNENPEPLLFTLLSNAYWARYLHLKHVKADPRELRRILRRSIDLINQRPINDRTAGFLPTKLEAYGMICEISRDYKKATEAYAEGIKNQIDIGLLDIATEGAISQSLPQVLSTDGALSGLGRLLLAYPRVALKRSEQGPELEVIFDRETLPPAGRGLLLEQQLNAVTSILQAYGPSTELCQALRYLAISIFSVYTETEFPIRRLRVLILFLRINSTHPSALGNTLLDMLLQKQNTESKSEASDADLGLRRFVGYLDASWTMSVAFSNERPDLQAVQSTLTAWSSMLQGCSDWQSLQTHVDDISGWLVQLESVAEYLDMQGLSIMRISALQQLVIIHELMPSSPFAAPVSWLSALGLQYVHLGYSGKAHNALQKAQNYLETTCTSPQDATKLFLAYAEYSLEIGNLTKCEESLMKARLLFDEGVQKKVPEVSTSEKRVELLRVIANVTRLHSSLAFSKGQCSKAIFYARQSVKLSQRAWAILERRWGNADNKICVETSEIDMASVTEGISNISLSSSAPTPIMSTTHAALRSIALWSLVPLLFRGLVSLSELFTHEGLLSEGRYYLEQSDNIANAVSAPYLIGQCLALAGHNRVRSGKVEQGLIMLRQANETTSNLQRDRRFAVLQSFLATAYALHGEGNLGESAHSRALETLQDLMSSSFIDGLVYRLPIESDLDLQMRNMTLHEPVPAERQLSKRRIPTKKPNSQQVKEAKPLTVPREKFLIGDASPLLRMKGQVLRQRVGTLIRQNHLDLATTLLADAVVQLQTPQDMVLQTLQTKDILLRQALGYMANDPVFCVLPESIISYPSIMNSGNHQDKPVMELSPRTAKQTALSKKAPATSSSRKPVKGLTPQQPDFVELLSQALDGMNNAHMIARTACSTATMHKVTDVMVKSLMMLSAVGLSKPKCNFSPLLAAYVMESARTMAMMREKQVIQVERRLTVRQEIEWPSDASFEDLGTSEIDSSLDCTAFQARYIDIIPTSWTAITLSLSESREEIRISKLRSGQKPFILNIPLRRQSSRDMDEEVFGFDQGKAELLDIIELANYSTHNAQDMSRKGAKAEWWEARSALDARLKDLLINIENIWLGGFRSMFSQTSQSPDLLSRFQQSLNNILDKHLPSRQKPVRVKKPSRIALDPRVLELFVGLGSPNEVEDVEEPLMDLLYFVIDILQFNGERNAYDEVDFDSMAIETIDALRHYHEAVKNELQTENSQHLILILDKPLHCFPWESLPCMNGHAVSRLPSLGCLRDRILQYRGHQQEGIGDVCEGAQVDRRKGAFVLNPAGDLTATQDKFEQQLRDLSDWESITQREPSEEEMERCLERQDIFLFFGHGSGGQYIRSRTIKKLNKCAVALLMGCSSGALTEAGEFEAYGTPINYMHAGCPALLATLWDVTDRDIDRFSHTVLEQWGLFQEAGPPLSSSPVKRSVKARGKRQVVESRRVRDDSTSLDQAVAKGRESCILRYLNGAAPVIYGIPAFLS